MDSWMSKQQGSSLGTQTLETRCHLRWWIKCFTSTPQKSRISYWDSYWSGSFHSWYFMPHQPFLQQIYMPRHARQITTTTWQCSQQQEHNRLCTTHLWTHPWCAKNCRKTPTVTATITSNRPRRRQAALSSQRSTREDRATEGYCYFHQRFSVAARNYCPPCSQQGNARVGSC